MSDESKVKYTIIHQAGTHGEALIVRDLLESNGIRALIPDENSPFPGIDLTPFSPAGGAGFDVCVPQSDAARAKTLLETAHPEPKEGGGTPSE